MPLVEASAFGRNTPATGHLPGGDLAVSAEEGHNETNKSDDASQVQSGRDIAEGERSRVSRLHERAHARRAVWSDRPA